MANASFGFTSLLNMPFSAAKFITAAGAALGAFAASVSIAGISNTRVGPSTGGQAICATGLIRLNVTAENTKFNYAGPSNNSALTEFLVESLQSCSTLATRITQGPYTVSSEYGIYSKLCFPKQGAENVQTVQLLTHGGTLDHTYWDFSPGYSYVDAAAEAGYATFSYDRLGTGLSDHPDPIQVVQASIQVQVAHQLVQLLREGQVGNASFKHVVGVGHSLGTALTQGVTTRYPRDFDAVILTGTSTSFSAVPIGVASTAQQIASTDPSGRFTGLASGYIIPAPVPQSVQFAFYREPYFDPKSKFHILYLLHILGANLATSFRSAVPDAANQRDRRVFDFSLRVYSIPWLYRTCRCCGW